MEKLEYSEVSLISYFYILLPLGLLFLLRLSVELVVDFIGTLISVNYMILILATLVLLVNIVPKLLFNVDESALNKEMVSENEDHLGLVPCLGESIAVVLTT